MNKIFNIAGKDLSLNEFFHPTRSKGVKEKFISGDRIGWLTIVEKIGVDKNNNAIYNCICDCGTTVKKYHGNHGIRSISCGCVKIINYYDLKRAYVYDLIRNAGCRKIKWGVTQSDLWTLWVKQGGDIGKGAICAETGQRIYLSGVNGRTASLDRIDPNKDYTIDNLQWVTINYNMSKGDKTDKEMFEVCYNMVIFHVSKDPQLKKELENRLRYI